MPRHMNGLTHDSAKAVSGQSVDDWVLGMLRDRGPQWLHQLEETLDTTHSAQLLFAIDRLSRCGHISMWRLAHGNLLMLRRNSETAHVSTGVAATAR